MPSIKYSIIIPTYNRGDILLDALQSAMKRLPPRTEIIVVNDGSILSQTCKEYILKNNIICLATCGATGAGAARNLGALAAKGSWLFFQDDDDSIAPNYWQSVAMHIENNCDQQNDVYGFCKSKSFSDRKEMLEQSYNNTSTFYFNENKSAYLKHKLAGLGVGFWVSKKLFTDVGGISEVIKVNEDTDFCLRLLKVGSTCYSCSDVGAFIYSGVHTNGIASSTTKSSNALLRMGYFENIIREHEDLLSTNRKTAFWLFKRYTKMAAKSRQFNSLKLILHSPLLRFSDRFFLLLYFAAEGLVALVRK